MWPPPSNSVEIPIPKLEYFKKGHWHPGWGGTPNESLYIPSMYAMFTHIWLTFTSFMVNVCVNICQSHGSYGYTVYIVMTHGHLGRLRPPPSLQRSATRDPAPLWVAAAIRMPQACLASEGLTHLATSVVTGAFFFGGRVGPTGRRYFCFFKGHLILNVAFYFNLFHRCLCLQNSLLASITISEVIKKVSDFYVLCVTYRFITSRTGSHNCSW